jgi:hypothetical protein
MVIYKTTSDTKQSIIIAFFIDLKLIAAGRSTLDVLRFMSLLAFR